MLEEFLSKRTIGAFFDVYRQIGYGFPEAICANGLASEFEFRGIPFKREVPIEVIYVEFQSVSFASTLLSATESSSKPSHPKS